MPVAYDFSDVTIRHLVSIVGNHKRPEKARLKIEFHRSLRLLSLQDIILLRETCKDQNIEIMDHFKRDVIDYCKAVDTSIQRGQNPTSIKFARHSRGSPWLSILIRLQADNPDLNFIIMKQILTKNFDLNLHSTRSGETILFHLIRIFDIKSLKYVFNSVKAENGININTNYFNKNGQTPLFVALELYKEEKKFKRIAAKREEMKQLQMMNENEKQLDKQNDKQTEKKADRETQATAISYAAQGQNKSSKNKTKISNNTPNKPQQTALLAMDEKAKHQRFQQMQKQNAKHQFLQATYVILLCYIICFF